MACPAGIEPLCRTIHDLALMPDRMCEQHEVAPGRARRRFCSSPSLILSVSVLSRITQAK